MNPKRIHPLYKEMDLQLRNKVPKRRVKAKLRADRTEPTHSNHVWAMYFVHDQLATGRKIRGLTVVDTYSRFSPAVDARFSYKGEDVVQTLERKRCSEATSDGSRRQFCELMGSQTLSFCQRGSFGFEGADIMVFGVG